MRAMLRYCTVACIVGLVTCPANAQTFNTDIELIRQRFASINRELPQTTQVTEQLDGHAVEGAKLTAYFSGQSLRKVLMQYFAESGYGVEEYYFWDERLFFVYRRKRRASQLEPDLEGIDENRFYFVRGSLGRWLDERGRQLVVEQPYAKAEEEKLYGNASEFARIARQKLPMTQPKTSAGGFGARPANTEGTVTDRESAAEQHQRMLRAEGCATCRVWVGGEAGKSLYVLDPRVVTGGGDTDKPPIMWFEVGFAKVVYLARPGVVYRSYQRP